MAETGLVWIKMAAGEGTRQCVELAATDSGVLVRGSENPAGPWLSFTSAEVEAFLDGAKGGEFDDLV
jgi:hypothetical protein